MYVRPARFAATCAAILLAGEGGPPEFGQGTCQLAELHAPGPVTNEWLGYSVAIHGDTVVAGAVYDDDNGPNSGSARVYRTNGSAWHEEQKLLAPDGATNHSFGWRVDVHGDAAVVGAPGADFGAGAAYVFRRTGGVWALEQKLVTATATFDYSFGRSVSIDGDAVAVGTATVTTSGDKGEIELYGGEVQVFRLAGPTWVHEATLGSAPGVEGDDFAIAVDLRGDRIAVGASGEDARGSASVFRFDGVQWTLEGKVLDPFGAVGDNFGAAVAVEGDLLAVGAFYDDEAGIPNSGSVSVFRFGGAQWALEKELVPSDAAPGDRFGRSVALSGGVILSGAHLDDDAGVDSGSVHVVRHDGVSWGFDQEFQASGIGPGDLFGEAVALDGSVAVVGARGDDVGALNAGSVHVVSVGAAACLSASPAAVSLSSGGAQSFALQSSGGAGDPYLLLGSTSGTAPGFSVDGVPVSLSIDAYTLFALLSPNTAPLSGSLGILDASGGAAASFIVPSGTLPSLAGLVVSHAFVVLEPSIPAVVSASNSVEVLLAP